MIHNKSRKKISIASGLAAIVFLLLGFSVVVIHQKHVSAAATITVNTNLDTAADDGVCTLREAITAANTDTASGANPGECIAGDGSDTVQFGISGSGVKTIQVLSGLPDITSSIEIDGYTQTGAAVNTNPAPQGVNTVLTIELDGSSCVGTCDIDVIGADTVTVTGLSIHSFIGTAKGAIHVEDSNNVVIEGNYIGVDAAGLAAGNNLEGVDAREGTTNIRIGGSSAAQRNVISNNSALTLGADNILISDDGNNTTSGITIAGNIVGLNPLGTIAYSNPSTGIRIKNGVKDVVIGGIEQTDANVVAGFTSTGINISQESDTPPEEMNEIIIENNFVGYATDLTTNLMSPGSTVGIGVTVIDPSILAGADVSGVSILDNFVIGTGFGGAISILNASANISFSNILVQGNDLDGDGFANISGITVGANVQDVQIGSTDPSRANTIHNFAVGIRGMRLGTNPEAALFGNNLYDNDNHGIDLCEDTDFNFICDVQVGPTANDVGDSDTGANNYINTPVVNSASQIGDQLTVNFDLDAADSPSDEYRLDFYYSDTADSSGFGEGQQYLGGATSANGIGNELTITIDDSINIENGVVTATTTAIDNTTTSGFGATSEFSAVLSDNITFEPAPDPPVDEGDEQTAAQASNSQSANLSQTGTETLQLWALIAGTISILTILFLKKRSTS